MKFNRVLIFGIIAFAFTAYAQEVQIKDEAAFVYASMEFSGSYQQIPAKIGEFIGNFFKQGLIPTGTLFGIYYNSPEEVKEADLKWAIGFPIASEAAVKEPLKRVEFKQGKIAYYLYKGPFENMAEAFTKIFKFINENGYKPCGPIIERYLDDPSTTKPENLRTEILVPVMK